MKQLNIYSTFLITTILVANTAYANPVDFLFGAGSFGRKAGTTADCRNLIQRYVENTRFMKDETWKTRVVEERNPDFMNDLEFMEESKYINSTLGVVDTKFVKEFDTQFYFSSLAKPAADGSIPMVDVDAKALVIYLHGSGTMKASGVGFAGKMNALAKLGYSSLSFDLPFHQLGSKNPALADSANFAEYLNKIIEKYKVPGQKVILVGHSFGPDVIAEYVTRYPHGANSAVLVSPGSFDKVTSKWYAEKTSKMDFGDTEMNDAGGRWAGQVTNGKLWSNPKAKGRVDPTVANPDLDIHVISGDMEEYVPGELDKLTGKPTSKPRDYDVEKVFKQYFSRVDVTIEPGIGHYIFNHKDSLGQDVVMRSVLKANGESLLNEKEIRKQVAQRFANRPDYELLALRYQKEPFFRKWMDTEAAKAGIPAIEQVKKFVATDDKKGAREILNNYMVVERQRMQAFNDNIKATANWAPEFYAENKVAIDALGAKGDHSVVQAKYVTLLQTRTPEELRKHASATKDVYLIPEKPQGRPEFNGEKREQRNDQRGDKRADQKSERKGDRRPSQETP